MLKKILKFSTLIVVVKIYKPLNANFYTSLFWGQKPIHTFGYLFLAQLHFLSLLAIPLAQFMAPLSVAGSRQFRLVIITIFLSTIRAGGQPRNSKKKQI